MPTLITGLMYEEHGDCSELKRQIHIEKQGHKYIAKAFENYDFVPINKGRFFYKHLLKDIEAYKKSRSSFYAGYKADIIKTVYIPFED
jgi:hypothetical protein